MDHTATYVVVRHPSVGPAYDYGKAYATPNATDAHQYLRDRSGPLAASNARISFWQEIMGGDGNARAVGAGRDHLLIFEVHCPAYYPARYNGTEELEVSSESAAQVRIFFSRSPAQ